MPNVAIADSGSGAASLLNGLNAAANQQASQAALAQQRQAQQDHEDLLAQMEALNQGWQPADTETAGAPVPGYGGKSLITRAPAQPNQDPARLATIGGKQYYKPTDVEAGKALVPAGQLGDALKAAGWDGKTPVTPDQSHALMMAISEAAPKDEPFDIDLSGKFKDAQGNPVPVVIGKKTKTVRALDLSGAQPAQQPGAAQPGAAPAGAFANRPTLALPRDANPETSDQTVGATPGASPSGAFTFSPKEAAEKPDVSQIVPGKAGPKGGLLMFDKNKQTVTEIPLPPGSKDVMTPAQIEADKDRHEREAERKDASKMKPAEARQIVKTKADAIAKANTEYAKALTTAIAPEDRSAALADRQSAYQAAQNEYEESIAAATGQPVPHNSWADTPAAASPNKTGKAKPVPTKPAAPAAAPAGRGGATPKAATVAPAIAEGTIIVNKKTKQRMRFASGDKGGQWIPIPPLR